MLIGELAKLAGVSVQAVRYYERRGLLPRPRRRPSGYREYDQEAARLIRIIKRAQSLGFTLREILPLISLRTPDRMRAVAMARLEDFDAKRRELARLLRECRCDAGGACLALH